MRAVLLTWNPGPGNDHVWSPAQWEQEVVAPCLEGRTVRTTWGVGNHVNGIAPGDGTFLYRQGAWGRGIVARGTIRSRPWKAPHWDRAKASHGATTNCVDVEWEEAVPVDLALEVDELEALIPEFGWRKVYASGRRTPASVGERLRQVWDTH